MREKRLKLPNKLDLSAATMQQKKFAKSIGIKLPSDATRSDAAVLIEKELDDDLSAAEGLKTYAKSKEIGVSDYVGEKYMHNVLFDHLKEADKVAFFCFCVYKFNKGQQGQKVEEQNLELNEHQEVFLSFAEEKVKDVYFMASMEEYIGEELMGFGKWERELPSGEKEVCFGGSALTRAYKEAMSYLEEKGLIN